MTYSDVALCFLKNRKCAVDWPWQWSGLKPRMKTLAGQRSVWLVAGEKLNAAGWIVYRLLAFQYYEKRLQLEL